MWSACLTYLAVAALWVATAQPYGAVVSLSAVFPLAVLWSQARRRQLDIDVHIQHLLGAADAASFRVHQRELPGYRFVDLHKAAEAILTAAGAVVIDSEHDENLTDILHAVAKSWAPRRIKRASNRAWPSGPEATDYLPSDAFWVAGGAAQPVVARLRYQEMRDRCVLEVACANAAETEAWLERIVTHSSVASIYRNQMLEVCFESAIKEDDGDIERGDRICVLFRATEPVHDDDIVIDDDVRAVLERNVVDLHRRREILKAHGVPVRRGVLLYGPPGTGKTFACRYLCGKLPHTTRILVAGTGLLQVKSIFNLARLLQPALVVLEDVDLVFASREINLYSSVLGELLDQMDGLRPFEDVGVILTTNAIDRLEAAIKDRPGRISQCIYFGPPNAELRRRYLERYLRDYPAPTLDIDALVAESKGATQAFLKEWVHRSVQVATERLEGADGRLQLEGDDFHTAIGEMRHLGEGAAARIVGFLKE